MNEKSEEFSKIYLYNYEGMDDFIKNLAKNEIQEIARLVAKENMKILGESPKFPLSAKNNLADYGICCSISLILEAARLSVKHDFLDNESLDWFDFAINYEYDYFINSEKDIDFIKKHLDEFKSVIDIFVSNSKDFEPVTLKLLQKKLYIFDQKNSIDNKANKKISEKFRQIYLYNYKGMDDFIKNLSKNQIQETARAVCIENMKILGGYPKHPLSDKYNIADYGDCVSMSLIMEAARLSVKHDFIDYESLEWFEFAVDYQFDYFINSNRNIEFLKDNLDEFESAIDLVFIKASEQTKSTLLDKKIYIQEQRDQINRKIQKKSSCLSK